jgi:hypothetical protein
MRNRKTGIGSWPAMLGTALVLAVAGQAQALSTILDIELDNGLVGTYATVEISENAGALDFTITLDSSLGPNADIHEFYFNVVNADITGIGITTPDPVQTPYEIEADPSVNGGAGSSFDYGINFGNGGGAPGNGHLQMANFTVFADQNLTLAELDEISRAKGGMIDLHLLLHVQSTDLFPGSDSEAVGGSILLPEPSAGLLLAMGLLTGLALQRRHDAG